MWKNSIAGACMYLWYNRTLSLFLRYFYYLVFFLLNVPVSIKRSIINFIQSTLRYVALVEKKSVSLDFKGIFCRVYIYVRYNLIPYAVRKYAFQNCVYCVYVMFRCCNTISMRTIHILFCMFYIILHLVTACPFFRILITYPLCSDHVTFLLLYCSTLKFIFLRPTSTALDEMIVILLLFYY